MVLSLEATHWSVPPWLLWPCFQLSHYHCFYSLKNTLLIIYAISLVPLIAPHTFLPATCHPSIVNTPTYVPTRAHTHLCMHTHTQTNTHASVAVKGRPNASFDVMALWSLSWFPLLLYSSIIHIVCLCAGAGAHVLGCSHVRNKTLFSVIA